jgi:hypothetical protein
VRFAPSNVPLVLPFWSGSRGGCFKQWPYTVCRGVLWDLFYIVDIEAVDGLTVEMSMGSTNTMMNEKYHATRTDSVTITWWRYLPTGGNNYLAVLVQ